MTFFKKLHKKLLDTLRISNIAFKTAFYALIFSTIITIAEYVLSRWMPIWVISIINICLIAFGTYFLIQGFIISRIMEARAVLKQFQDGNFEDLNLSDVPVGDELDSLKRQVYRIGNQLQREIRRLEQIENYRKEFLGNVTHELKTPIFAIQGFASTLQEGALHDEEVNTVFLEKIIRNSERLSLLTNDLSSIAQIESGEMKMESEIFSIQPLLEEVIESTTRLAQSASIKVHFSLPPNLPDVFADRERIRQVLINLVENAIKYNREKGNVEIVVRVRPRKLRISIIDDGIGIPKEDISRITERFYRVDRSRSRSQGGTGLGLSIVKHILERHNTSLQISSEPQKGSAFSFELETKSQSRD